MPNGIEFEGRYAQVGTFPIGIDPTQFVDLVKQPKVVDRIKQLKERFRGCKVSSHCVSLFPLRDLDTLTPPDYR